MKSECNFYPLEATIDISHPCHRSFGPAKGWDDSIAGLWDVNAKE